MKLGQVARLFKIGYKVFIGIVFVYYLTLLVLGPAAKRFIQKAFPPKDAPTLTYGKLEPLEFMSKATINEDYLFELNTKNGRLPTGFPARMKVFKFDYPQFSYQAGKVTQGDAQVLGFTDNDLISGLQGTVYRWRNTRSGGVLEIDSRSMRITLITSLQGKERAFTPGSITWSSGVEIAKSMFEALNRFEGYRGGTYTVRLGAYTRASSSTSGGDSSFILSETQDQTSSRVAMVDFFRQVNVWGEDYPVVGADPKKGLLHAIVSKPDTARPYFSYPVVEAYYWDYDPKSDATYPIIPVADAWNAISEGKGVITHITSGGANPFEEYKAVNVGKILINDIYLAYYETSQFQKYMQPIYVFEGVYTAPGGKNGNIALYFPALSAENIARTEIPIEQPTPQ